jgi:hypothetical protein
VKHEEIRAKECRAKHKRVMTKESKKQQGEQKREVKEGEKKRKKERGKERRKKKLEKIKGRREDNKNKTKINTKHYNLATQRTKEHKRKKEEKGSMSFLFTTLKV